MLKWEAENGRQSVVSNDGEFMAGRQENDTRIAAPLTAGREMSEQRR